MIFPSPSKTSESGLGLLSMVMFIAVSAATITASLVLMQPSVTAEATARTNEKLEAISGAFAAYRANAGSNPTTLDALVTAPAGMTCTPDVTPTSATFRQIRGWCGPYLISEISDSFKRDGWGQLLQIDGAQVKSCGPNRVCGDGDDIAVTP